MIAPRLRGWPSAQDAGHRLRPPPSPSAPVSGPAPSAGTDRRAPEGMVLIPGGKFKMGSENGLPDERPVREIELDSFYLDAHEITNAQFAEFVKATGYKTVAERPLDPAEFPGVPKEQLKPGAAVLKEGKGWAFTAGADWKHPLGPGSDLTNKDQHPVVQVSWEDANAYAAWAGKRLPTEAEWEFAARGGNPQLPFIWGSEPPSESKPQANIWQGEFPKKNAKSDGFAGTAPVKSFARLSNGLSDMAGNVWEWCQDFYHYEAYKLPAVKNPTGPSESLDPEEEGVPKRVMRGGSFLCAESVCQGYRPSARMKSSPGTALCHTGFRCA